jgi:2'-5' RNA ligase
MDKITYSQETGNKRNDARTEISQRWHRRPPKIIKEPSPDHFLALRLSHDPSVISAITSIQNAIVQHSPHLERACIDPITAHLTLGVLRLPDAATKEAAQAALVNAATAAALTTPCFVTLRGIDNFRNQVVFFDLAEAQGVEAEGCGGREQVIQLAAAVRQHFGDQGLLLQADRAFVPHVTIAKLSKLQPWQRGARGTRRSPSWRQQQKKVSLEEEKESKKQQHEEEEEEEEEEVILKEEKKVATVDSGFAIEATSKHNNYNVERKKEQQLYIPKESYSAVSSISTGAVQVTELQLCAMEGRKPGEYYKLISSVRLHT